MSWQDILKGVTYLGSYEILKIMSPRMFLEELQNEVGGKVTGKMDKQSSKFTLAFDSGYVKIEQRGRGEFFINYNGRVIASGFNLKKLMGRTKREMGL